MQRRPKRSFVVAALALIFSTFILLLTFVVMSAEGAAPAAPARSSVTAPAVTLSPSPTARSSATPPTSTPAYMQCAWQWATEALDDVSEAAQAIFDKNEVAAEVLAHAYGENCIDFGGGTPVVRYFAAMTTDFQVNAYVPSVSDGAVIGAALEQIYALLVGVGDAVELPARIGYLTVDFIEAQGTPPRIGGRVFLSMRFGDIEAALSDGRHGEALLEALDRWPFTPTPTPT